MSNKNYYIGQNEVGKTLIIKRICKKEFNDEELSSNGIDFFHLYKPYPKKKSF